MLNVPELNVLSKMATLYESSSKIGYSFNGHFFSEKNPNLIRTTANETLPVASFSQWDTKAALKLPFN